MNERITERGIVCSRAELNIERTLKCGQLFRFFHNADGTYSVASGDKTCKLYYDGDNTVIETNEPEYFVKYFDFETDYSCIMAKLSEFEELREALSCGGGLRILRQQPFEATVSFIISANNNIKRIQGIIERICARLCDGDGNIPPFPSREKLMTLSVEDFSALGCGFRDRYLHSTVPLLTDDYLASIGAMPQELAKKELCKLMGVGPKVADCILLFAYKKTASYPVDTWIFKAGRTDELDTPEKVHEYYSRRYGENAGYAQQYVFYYNQQRISNLTINDLTIAKYF